MSNKQGHDMKQSLCTVEKGNSGSCLWYLVVEDRLFDFRVQDYENCLQI